MTGCGTAPYLWALSLAVQYLNLSQAIQFLAEARGCGSMSHMLDDFLGQQTSLRWQAICIPVVMLPAGHTCGGRENQVRGDLPYFSRDYAGHHMNGSQTSTRQVTKMSLTRSVIQTAPKNLHQTTRA